MPRPTQRTLSWTFFDIFGPHVTFGWYPNTMYVDRSGH